MTVPTGTSSEPVLRAWTCEQVVVRFTGALDRLDADEMKRHFHHAGSWHRPSGVVEGHRGIDEFVAGVAPDLTMRHIITNTRIIDITETEVLVESYFTVYLRRGDTASDVVAPSAIGQYTDRLTCDHGVWRIRRRDVRFDIQ